MNDGCAAVMIDMSKHPISIASPSCMDVCLATKRKQSMSAYTRAGILLYGRLSFAFLIVHNWAPNPQRLASSKWSAIPYFCCSAMIPAVMPGGWPTGGRGSNGELTSSSVLSESCHDDHVYVALSIHGSGRVPTLCTYIRLDRYMFDRFSYCLLHPCCCPSHLDDTLNLLLGLGKHARTAAAAEMDPAHPFRHTAAAGPGSASDLAEQLVYSLEG